MNAEIILALLGVGLVMSSGVHAEPVAIFGLPLGGKLTKPMKACPLDVSKSKATVSLVVRNLYHYAADVAGQI